MGTRSFSLLWQRIPVALRKFFELTLWLILGCRVLLFIYDWCYPLEINVVYSTQVKDRNGELLHAFLSADDKWRMYAELDEITPLLKKTFLFKEDRFFEYHPGINIAAIGKAFLGNLKEGRRISGASTISMQVARMLERRPRTYRSKLVEVWNALRIERKYSKEEILQLYFNLLPFGGNVEGVKAASLLYFGKPPQLLSLAEITTLTVIPNNPTNLNPEKDRARLLSERDKWLRRFGEKRLFAEEVIADALSEPLTASRREGPRQAPHLAMRLFRNYPSKHTIISTLSRGVQKQTETLVANYVNRIRFMGIRNASVLVLNNETMEVEAYVGSADFGSMVDGGQVDGVRAVRSPGSTLKPALYAAAFDEGLAIPKTIVNDVPSNFSGYEPENFDLRFNGPVTIEFALSRSLNIPAVKLLKALEVKTFVGLLRKAGFRTIDKQASDLGLSLILGGCGTTLEELTRLYSVFSREGDLSQIRYVKENDASVERVPLISAESAYMISQILSQVDRPDLPNNFDNTYRLPRIAWKTGTSYGKRDAWSIGYNRRYTIGVWVGNFSGEGVPELSGANIATPLLFELFNSVDYNSKADVLQRPVHLETRKVCSVSGDVPSDGCDQLINSDAIAGISHFRRCEHQKKVFTDSAGRISYCASCLPASGKVVQRTYPNLAPELIAFYTHARIPYERIPPHNPDCDKLFVDGPPVIVSPQSGSEYYIQAESPSELQLACHASQDVEYVTWYVNDRLLAKTPPAQPFFFIPPVGVVKISCTDNKGRNSDIVIFTKRF